MLKVRRRHLLLLLAWLSLCSSMGCVRRRMTVRTNPPGAMVYVDHQNIGTSPVSTNFTYYGTRQFEVIKDGYRTEKFLRKFDPPWYQWPVLDFISESIWPYEKRDERVIDVQMSPEIEVPTQALIQSGEDLRSQASNGLALGTGIIPTSPAGELVIPRGSLPYVPPVPPTTPTLPPGSIPIGPGSPLPNFFDNPPASIPATQVAPGSSYRPDLQ